MHLFFCRRMKEPYLRGMQHKPFCRSTAIEPVAYDRSIQPLRMCRMYPQLVCPTGERKEVNKCPPVRIYLSNGIAGDRRLAMRAVHHLTRTVKRIREQRQIDESLGLKRCLTLYDRFIPLQ